MFLHDKLQKDIKIAAKIINTKTHIATHSQTQRDKQTHTHTHRQTHHPMR